MKLRKVRDRQWNRHLQRLCKLGDNVLTTPGLERWHNRRAHAQARRNHRATLRDGR